MVATSSDVSCWDCCYDEFRDAIKARFAGAKPPLFTTSAEGLFVAFLAALPEGIRQHYNCNNCRHFIDGFGGLVEILDDGQTRPVFWDAASTPQIFKASVSAMEKLIARAKVTGVFYCSDAIWGVPENVSGKTGQAWTHLHARPGAGMIYRESVVKNASQAMAEKREEHAMALRGIVEYPVSVAVQALTLLKSGDLYRPEHALPIASWFVDLHEVSAGKRGKVRDALIWAAVARAPVGFAHIKSGMIGTLLEDIQAGASLAAIQRRWREKMDPLQYQRPQSDPSEGNIAQAEKIVSALKSAGALDRRYARLDDVQAIWRPAERRDEPARTGGGVFAHVKSKGTRTPLQGQVPSATMTFEKFRREVLHDAASIDAEVPQHGSFVALVTAVYPEAPPIIQWDTEAHRNPVSWYVWTGGSPAAQFGLAPGWVKAAALTLLPSMWGDEAWHQNQGRGLIILLDGAKDSWNDGGIALFPEVLKSEYHAIRKTIEVFSRGAKLGGAEEASACGLDLRQGKTWHQRLRVTDTRGMQTIYTLDRWD